MAEVPSNLLLLRYGAKRIMATIMFVWGLAAVAMMLVHTPIEFYALTRFDRWVAPWLGRFVNRSPGRQEFYERRLCHGFHARQIRYIMRPEK